MSCIDIMLLSAGIMRSYVTGYHWQAILSRSIYGASTENEQLFHPPLLTL
ncbi:hypothetical protein [Vibrio sinaloensis]|nr:hypothetical protein [Vibrio sinaloensis]MCZ4294497.1 hypothetical protein [Vibrio sinaloensis]